MKTKSKTTHFNVSADVLYQYLSDIENLPQWATAFCLCLKREGSDHKVETPQGEVYFRIDADSRTGVIDMWAGPEKNKMMRWPARVVDDNFGGSLYIFTAIQMAGESDESFERSCATLDEELENVRRAVEVRNHLARRSA